MTSADSLSLMRGGKIDASFPLLRAAFIATYA